MSTVIVFRPPTDRPDDPRDECKVIGFDESTRGTKDDPEAMERMVCLRRMGHDGPHFDHGVSYEVTD